MMNAILNAHHHSFWYLLSLTCIVWYSTITIYVAIRGAFDIRTMLKHLGSLRDKDGDK